MKSNDRETVGSYPDPNVPNEVKETSQYILPYLKTAYHDYLNNQYFGYSNRSRKIRNKRYRLSEEDVSIYKTRVNITDDTSYSNLDFTPISIVPKFADIVVNAILDRRFKITASARDGLSLEEEQKYVNKLRGDMYSIGLNEKLSQVIGKDFTDKDAPTTDQEVELKKATEYKDDMEIAFEQGIREVRQMNRARENDRYVLDDLVTCGEGVLRNYLMDNGEIKQDYIPSENFIRSFSYTPDNRRLKHAGHVTKMTLSELRRRVGKKDEFTEAMWEEIASKVTNNKSGYRVGQAVYVNNSSDSSAWYDSVDVDVVELEFVDFNYDNYEYKETEYGGKRIKKRSDDYLAVEKPEGDLVVDSYETVYKGSWIVGTDYLFDYGKAHNISINSNDFYTANLSYIVYTMYGKSVVEKIIPFAEQVQLIHLKMQQLSAKVRPNGVAIDVSALENAVSNGNGGFFEPLELSEIFDETGNIYYRSDPEDLDGRGNRVPITPLVSTIRDALQPMIELYNHYANQIRDISGVNEYKDGTNNNPNTLVGVQRESIKASNNATAAIDSAFYDIIERSAERTIEFFQDVVKNKAALDRYKRILGTETMDTLDRIKNVPIDMISVKLEFEPTIEEKAVLDKHIEIALGQNQIELEDSLLIREIDNIGLAIKMLIQRKQKKGESMAKLQQMSKQAKTQEKQQDSQMKIQEISAETKIKTDAEVNAYMQKAKIDLELKEKMLQMEMAKAQQEIDGKIKVALINAGASSEKAVMGEDRKDARDKAGKTMESKLIEQRKDRIPEQDFTAGEYNENLLNQRVEGALQDNPAPPITQPSVQQAV